MAKQRNKVTVTTRETKGRPLPNDGYILNIMERREWQRFYFRKFKAANV